MLLEIAIDTDIISGSDKKCTLCGKKGHKSTECVNLEKLKAKLAELPKT